jgi:hypothetical protein
VVKVEAKRNRSYCALAKNARISSAYVIDFSLASRDDQFNLKKPWSRLKTGLNAELDRIFLFVSVILRK